MADQERKTRRGPWTSDDSKQSIYFPEGVIGEIAEEAQRLQRSMSWVMQRAWKHARRTIKGMPSRSNRPAAGPEAVVLPVPRESATFLAGRVGRGDQGRADDATEREIAQRQEPVLTGGARPTRRESSRPRALPG